MDNFTDTNSLDKKWQENWEKEKVYEADRNREKETGGTKK